MVLFDSRSQLVRLLVCGLFIGLVSVPVVAQPTVSLRGNVGASFFRSPELEQELLNSGTSFGLEAGVRVYRGLAITVGGGYDSFTLNEDNARLFGAEGSDLAFLSGTLGLRYTYLNGTDAHPYVSTGVGLYQLRTTNRREFAADGELIRTGEQSREQRTGLHIALGSLFRLDDTYAVFFEPRYVFYDVEMGLLEGAPRYFTLRLGVDVLL